MFQVFNMGHRMEIICDESTAKEIIKLAKKFQIDSKIVGYCEKSSVKNKNELEILSEHGKFKYN